MAHLLRRLRTLAKPQCRSLCESVAPKPESPQLVFTAPPKAALPLGVLQVGNFTIKDFLKTIGRGVDANLEKIAGACEDLRDLLVMKSRVLRKLGVPVKHRKLILRYTHSYRLGVWKPRKIRD